MNEFIDITFRKPSGVRLKVNRQTNGGIEFDERDPLERSIGFQLNGRSAATKERMRRIGQVKGWDPNQFKLKASVEGGNVVLRGDDPDALPEGHYSLRLEVEEVEVRQAKTSVDIDQDGHGELEVTVFDDVRDVDVDLTNCDNFIRTILAASTIDGQDGETWVTSADHRPTRKACLLNLMASLRVRPTLSDVLIDQVQNVFRVFNDRAYFKVDRDLFERIEALVKDPKKPFFREGPPTAKIHGRLLDAIPDKAQFDQGLVSYRGEGKPSLQMVIAKPAVGLPHTYAEFDLDLGNPLQDVLGFVVHVGELLDGKPTNHLDLRKQLAKTKANDFLYYRVTTG